MYPTNFPETAKVVTGVSPQSNSGSVVNGASIDREDLLAAVIHGQVGAASGTPTSYTVDYKLQESADGTTGWTDVANAVVPTISADNSDDHVNVNLKGVKRYIRVVATVAFTGGTSPAVPVAADVTLGGAVNKPVSYS